METRDRVQALRSLGKGEVTIRTAAGTRSLFLRGVGSSLPRTRRIGYFSSSGRLCTTLEGGCTSTVTKRRTVLNDLVRSNGNICHVLRRDPCGSRLKVTFGGKARRRLTRGLARALARVRDRKVARGVIAGCKLSTSRALPKKRDG